VNPKHTQVRLNQLGAYPFERLKQLFEGHQAYPALTHIDAGAGEPRLPLPSFVTDVLNENMSGFSKYPASRGNLPLRQHIADWLTRRYGLQHVDADTQVLTANGTRESLFSVAHALVNPEMPGERPLVMMPNPMYQIYLGAALTCGAEACLLPCVAENNFAQSFEHITDDQWKRTAFIYICSPSNPTGWIAGQDYYERLLKLADMHDFYIVADECYSEIYQHTPPIGLLEVCAHLGRHDFKRCLVMNSLSKRSALPGLRSGLIAGDAGLIERFAKMRSYTGAATPLPLQQVAAAAWQDEAHVQQHLQVYRASLKAFFDAYADPNCSVPAGSFFVWLPVDDGEAFALAAFRQQAVTVLPGAYLAADAIDGNPGSGYIRAALVDGPEKAAELAQRLRQVRA